jgi:hypothetical protein
MDEQLVQMIQGLEHLVNYDGIRQNDPNSPLVTDRAMTDSYRQWRDYFSLYLADPVVYRQFSGELQRTNRGDLWNYVQRAFPFSAMLKQNTLNTSGATPAPVVPNSPASLSGSTSSTSLDQLLESYLSAEVDALTAAEMVEAITSAPTPAPEKAVPPAPVPAEETPAPDDRFADLEAKVKKLESDNASLRKRLSVKLGRGDGDEIEEIVADYERRAMEAEAKLNEALNDAPAGKGKKANQSTTRLKKSTQEKDLVAEFEAKIELLEKKNLKKLAEVASLAQGIINHLTTFLNDKACMVGPGEQLDIEIKFAELQAPIIQMVRKLKKIEESTKQRCGVSELTELVEQLFGQ